LEFVVCLSFGAWNLELIWDLEFAICLSFGAWNLELIWDLEFVIWDFIDVSLKAQRFLLNESELTSTDP